MTVLALRGTRIGQAHIRASSADAASCGARCAAIIPGLDVEPAMPPQAILCIRSLQDPLPGGIDASTRHTEMRPAAWEEAMRASLRDALYRAVRPIDGPAPASADAIFFADPSEMLACAARDACGGSLRQHWWWRYLLPAAGFEAVIQAWLDAPTHLAAAFESLVATGAAMTFVQQLSSSAAARLVDAVLRAHCAEPLADGLAPLWTIAQPADARTAAAIKLPEHHLPRLDGQGRSIVIRAPAPWSDIVPVAWEQGGLTPQQRVFAAICIVLRRAPTLPRRPGFVAAVIAHVRDNAAPPLPPAFRALDAIPPSRDHATTAVPSPGRQVHDARTPQADLPDPPTLRRPTPTEPIASRKRLGSPATRPNAAVDETRLSSRETTWPPQQRGAPSERALATEAGPPLGDDFGTESRATEPVSQCNATAPDLEAGIESAYAGAFFLLNVARDLELYADGWSAVSDLHLDVWDFIELIARDHLTDEEFEGDSLGGLLQSLAAPAAPPASPLDPHERIALVARVRAHVTAALVVEDAMGVLVRRRGRVVRTAAHVDVHFLLDRHPIEIRIARLDRNPGWIPAAGVHVGFHFN